MRWQLCLHNQISHYYRSHRRRPRRRHCLLRPRSKPTRRSGALSLAGRSTATSTCARFRKEEPSAYENNFAELFSLYEQGKLKPIVTESFAFEDYVAAFNVFTERKVMGKVTLEIKTEA